MVIADLVIVSCYSEATIRGKVLGCTRMYSTCFPFDLHPQNKAATTTTRRDTVLYRKEARSSSSIQVRHGHDSLSTTDDDVGLIWREDLLHLSHGLVSVQASSPAGRVMDLRIDWIFYRMTARQSNS